MQDGTIDYAAKARAARKLPQGEARHRSSPDATDRQDYAKLGRTWKPPGPPKGPSQPFIDSPLDVLHVIPGIMSVPTGILETEDAFMQFVASKYEEAGWPIIPGYLRAMSKIRRGGIDIATGAAEALAPESGSTVAEVSNAVGQGLGFMGMAALTGGTSAGISAVAQAAHIGTLGALSVGGHAYQETLQAGGTENQAMASMLLNMGVGTSEAFPLAKILNRMNKASGGGLTRALLKRSLGEALAEGGEEFGQETFQQVAGNIIAKNLVGYDEDRALLEGAWHAGKLGFAAGFILSGLGSGVSAMRQPPPDPGGGISGLGVEPGPGGPVRVERSTEAPTTRQPIESQEDPRVRAAVVGHLKRNNVQGRQVTPTTDEDLELAAFEEDHGRELVLVEADDGQPMNLPASAGEGVTILDVNALDGKRSLIFHEAVHGIPEADRRALVESIQETYPDFFEGLRGQYAYEFGLHQAELPEAERVDLSSRVLDEEGAARAAEEMTPLLEFLFDEPGALEAIEAHDPGLVRRILDAIIEVLNKLPGIQLDTSLDKRIQAIRELLGDTDATATLTGKEWVALGRQIKETIDTAKLGKPSVSSKLTKGEGKFIDWLTTGPGADKGGKAKPKRDLAEMVEKGKAAFKEKQAKAKRTKARDKAVTEAKKRTEGEKAAKVVKKIEAESAAQAKKDMEPGKGARKVLRTEVEDTMEKETKVVFIAGMTLEEGDILDSPSGGELTPFPRVSFASKVEGQATMDRVDAWITENALAEGFSAQQLLEQGKAQAREAMLEHLGLVSKLPTPSLERQVRRAYPKKAKPKKAKPKKVEPEVEEDPDIPEQFRQESKYAQAEVELSEAANELGIDDEQFEIAQDEVLASGDPVAAAKKIVAAWRSDALRTAPREAATQEVVEVIEDAEIASFGEGPDSLKGTPFEGWWIVGKDPDAPFDEEAAALERAAAPTEPDGRKTWSPADFPMGQFNHLVRSTHDPKRLDRKAQRKKGKGFQAWEQDLGVKHTPEWEQAILELLSDGRPRTFNEIVLNISGNLYTAEIASGHTKAPGNALDSLMSEGRQVFWAEYEHTIIPEKDGVPRHQAFVVRFTTGEVLDDLTGVVDTEGAKVRKNLDEFLDERREKKAKEKKKKAKKKAHGALQVPLDLEQRIQAEEAEKAKAEAASLDEDLERGSVGGFMIGPMPSEAETTVLELNQVYGSRSIQSEKYGGVSKSQHGMPLGYQGAWKKQYSKAKLLDIYSKLTGGKTLPKARTIKAILSAIYEEYGKVTRATKAAKAKDRTKRKKYNEKKAAKAEPTEEEASASITARAGNQPIVFASGLSRPGNARPFIRAGHPIGVVMGEVSKPLEKILIGYLDVGGEVFVDSGAFSKKPVSFAAVLKRYAKMAAATNNPEGLWLVMPDKVGEQDKTLTLLEKYASEIEELHRDGATLLIALQRGELDGADFFIQAQRVIGLIQVREGVVPAIPYNKAAWTLEEVVEFANALHPPVLHLLGGGLAKAKAVEAAIRKSGNQITRVRGDSNRRRSMVGKETPLAKGAEASIAFWKEELGIELTSGQAEEYLIASKLAAETVRGGKKMTEQLLEDAVEKEIEDNKKAIKEAEVTVAQVPTEEGMFGTQDKAVGARKVGAPVKASQAVLFIGEKDQAGQLNLEQIEDDRKAEEQPKGRTADEVIKDLQSAIRKVKNRQPPNRKAAALEGWSGFQMYVRALGGARYVGDLANLEEDQRKVRGFANLIQKKGASRGLKLDDIGEYAWGAGFFSERPTEREVIDALEEDLAHPQHTDTAKEERAYREKKARNDAEQMAQAIEDGIIFAEDVEGGFPWEDAEERRFGVRRRVDTIRMREAGIKATNRSGGRPLVRDVGKLLVTDRRDYRNPTVMRAAIAQGAREFDYQMKQERTGFNWYEEDIAEAFKVTGRIHPELRRSERARSLFTVFAALLSNGQSARRNWYNAGLVYGEYQRSGEILRKNPESGKVWGHQGKTIAIGLGLVDHMIQELGSYGMTRWLMTEHKLRELRDMRRRSAQNDSIKRPRQGFRNQGRYVVSGDMSIEGRMGSIVPGAIILGPKVGPFMLNLNGIDEGTIDRWATRMFGRYFGTIRKGRISKEGLHDTPTTVERKYAKILFAGIGRQRGVSQQTAQAVLWFYEQQLYFGLGIASAKPEFFSEGAQDYADAQRKGDVRGDAASARKAGKGRHTPRGRRYAARHRIEYVKTGLEGVIHVPGYEGSFVPASARRVDLDLGAEERKLARGSTHPRQDKRLQALLRGEKIRIRTGDSLSAIVRGYVEDDVPAFPVVGAQVVDYRDAAVLFGALRSPLVERMSLLLVRDEQVERSVIFSVGSVNTTLSPSKPSALRASLGPNVQYGDVVYISHNHPSGDPTPSREDIQAYGTIRSLLEIHGVTVYGLVTNGNRYALVDMPLATERVIGGGNYLGSGSYEIHQFQASKRDFEAVDYGHRLDSAFPVVSHYVAADYANRITRDENTVVAIYTNMREHVVGVRVHPGPPDPQKLTEAVLQQGAYAVVLLTDSEKAAEGMLKGRKYPGELSDVVLLRNGSRPESLAYRIKKTGRVQEMAFSMRSVRQLEARQRKEPVGPRQVTTAEGQERFMAVRRESQQFRDWFEDSKVVDKNGDPEVVYHGTDFGHRFDQFITPSFFGSEFAAGTYAMSEQAYQEEPPYNARLIPVYLSIQRPATEDDIYAAAEKVLGDRWKDQPFGVREHPAFQFVEGGSGSESEAVIDELQLQGFDGARIENDAALDAMMTDIQSWVVFEPEQVKSAIGNSGAYSGTAADIRFAVRRDELYPDSPSTFSRFVIPSGELARRANDIRTMEADDPPPPILPEGLIPSATDPEINNLYDLWRQERQVSVAAFESDASQKAEELRRIVGKRTGKEMLKESVDRTSFRRARQLDEALHLYIDLKEADRNGYEDEYALYESKLSRGQKAAYARSQQLSEEEMDLAERYLAENRELGIQAMEADVIHSFREHYSARIWKPKKESDYPQGVAKYTLRTKRALPRAFTSILQGWAAGRDLQVHGVNEAQFIARRQIVQVIHDRNLMLVAKKSGVVSALKQPGWVQINHPNFTQWVSGGKADEGSLQSYGLDTFVNEDGDLFHKVPMYAKAGLARKLNRALGHSLLEGKKGIDELTTFNALMKAQVLAVSFFHHQAYLRSFIFAGPVEWGQVLHLRRSYYEGRQAIEQFGPEVQELVRAGMTIGRIQDIETRKLEQKTAIGKVIDKVPMLRETKNAMLTLRDQQINWLFHRLGPNLKVLTGLLEYRHLLDKHKSAIEQGKMTRYEVAKIAALIVNGDFGGLNLEQEGGSLGGDVRDPTVQHVFRLLALAPDWTESNVLTMVRAFDKGAQGAAFREMWGRVFLRAGVATILFNLIMALWDDDDAWTRFKKSWEAGKLRWLDVDITPIYQGLGGDPDRRKYLSLIGHFRDPIKFVVNPVRSAKHKSSIVGGAVLEAVEGTDWAGREFTSYDELLGIDYDKGTYKTSRRNADGTWRYRAGDPKAGKLTGQTVKWSFASGALTPAQVPSYLINQTLGLVPIPGQNAMAWFAGEMDGLDAILKSTGLMIGSGMEIEQP